MSAFLGACHRSVPSPTAPTLWVGLTGGGVWSLPMGGGKESYLPQHRFGMGQATGRGPMLPASDGDLGTDESLSPVSQQRKTSAIARWNSANLTFDDTDVTPPTSAMFGSETLQTHVDESTLPDMCRNRCNSPAAEPASQPDGSIADRAAVPVASIFEDSCLEFQDEIGRGAFGCVFRARVRMDGRTVAVKRSKIDPAFSNRELTLLLALCAKKPANVVKLLGHYHVLENDILNQFLVFEFMPASLSAHLRSFVSRQQYIPIEQAIACLDQVSCGLAELHRHNICHRDLKPENVLVNMGTGIVKICDLGSAKVLSSAKAGVTYIGSRYYRAPELLLDVEEYTLAIDMWSLGCIFAELLSGQVLFHAPNNAHMLARQSAIFGVSVTIAGLKSRALDQPRASFCRHFKARIAPAPSSMSLARLPTLWSNVLDRPRKDEAWSQVSQAQVASILDGLLALPPLARLQAHQVSELTSGLVDSIAMDDEQVAVVSPD